MKNTNLLLICGTLLSIAPLATGADKPVPSTVPTNLPGIAAVAAPPTSFDALNASDEDLAAYGLPPRPDANNSPKAFASWKRAMLASKTRLTGVTLEPRNMVHGPAKIASPNSNTASSNAANAANTENTSYSYNWSGVAAFSPASSYNYSTSFYWVIGEHVVPVAREPFGVCDGLWDYSSSWYGIDGWDSNDVLQAGTESDAYCVPPGYTGTYYGGWIEWYPYGSVGISGFPVSPGDDMYVEVWNTTSTQGYAYLVNLNTNQAVEFSLTAYPGHSLVGNVAEWIVERPGVYYGQAYLQNYISDYFSECYASTFNGTEYYPGSASASLIDMLDNNGNVISAPTLLGPTAIWFQDTGSAR